MLFIKFLFHLYFAFIRVVTVLGIPGLLEMTIEVYSDVD